MQNAKKNDGNNFEIVTAGGNVSVTTAALTVNDITLDNSNNYNTPKFRFNKVNNTSISSFHTNTANNADNTSFPVVVSKLDNIGETTGICILGVKKDGSLASGGLTFAAADNLTGNILDMTLKNDEGSLSLKTLADGDIMDDSDDTLLMQMEF